MATYNYQVQRSPDGVTWTNITGASGSFDAISPFTHDLQYVIQSADAGDYIRCKVTDSLGNISYSGLVGPVDVTSPPPQPPPSGTYIFSDDFNGTAGTAPDPAKWVIMNGNAPFGDPAIPGNVFLDGSGHLIVRTARKAGGGYNGGFVSTFNYGSGWPPSVVKASFPVPFRIDTRVLMPNTAGAHSSLWMMTVNRPTSQKIYELDIAEERTTLDRVYGVHQHTWLNGSDIAPADGQLAITSMRTNWHVYSGEVYSDHVSCYCDGVLAHTFYGVSGSYGAIFSNGIAPGGTWGAAGGQPASSDPGPWDMLVDYVRVSAL